MLEPEEEGKKIWQDLKSKYPGLQEPRMEYSDGKFYLEWEKPASEFTWNVNGPILILQMTPTAVRWSYLNFRNGQPIRELGVGINEDFLRNLLAFCS